jgi:predicted extracellular nuclease
VIFQPEIVMPAHFLAFWNVENLFAPEGHPGRIPWIAKRLAGDLKGWTEALYRTKLAQLAKVIAAMNGGAGPDILGVCEVEDRKVLEDLAAAVSVLVPARVYGIVHADNTRDQRGIDTAFLYDPARYTVDPALIFNHFVIRRTGTRDITQATFRTMAGRDLVVLCNHWPSRSGGTVESAGFRATAGETLGYWHERIREEVGETAAVIAFGDFNDDPFDASLRFNANAWRERGDVERAESARFYNLAWEYLSFVATDRKGKPRQLDGTLYFKGDGNLFDQILASRSLLDRSPTALKVRDGTAGVFALSAMVDHRVSEGPVRFGLPKGDAAKNVDTSGFSDHFPVSVMVDESE